MSLLGDHFCMNLGKFWDKVFVTNPLSHYKDILLILSTKQDQFHILKLQLFCKPHVYTWISLIIYIGAVKELVYLDISWCVLISPYVSLNSDVESLINVDSYSKCITGPTGDVQDIAKRSSKFDCLWAIHLCCDVWTLQSQELETLAA